MSRPRRNDTPEDSPQGLPSDLGFEENPAFEELAASGTALKMAGCEQFELSISRYIDGDLSQLDSERVVAHLAHCSPCREFAESLQSLCDLHRDAIDPDQALSEVDTSSEFKEITRKLYAENVERLAGVCYELGKAYILAGTGRFGVRVVCRKPRPIPRMREKGNRLFREGMQLADRAGVSSKPLKASKGLFKAPSSSGNQTLETGKDFLLGSLRLDPANWQARIYLGHYFRVTDRNDLAKKEFRKVFRKASDTKLRLIALTKLGLTYSYERRYEKAIECFETVWKHKMTQRDPHLGISTGTNLAIFNAKLDRFEASVGYFDKLLELYPNRVGEVRGFLRQQGGFKELLKRRTAFRDQLKERYPLLFAS